MEFKPIKGQFVRYTPDDSIHRVAGWLSREREIARIENVETGKRGLIIISFTDGLNSLLENATKKEAEESALQCHACGCRPCECHELYPFCDHCNRYMMGLDYGDTCDCGRRLTKGEQ